MATLAYFFIPGFYSWKVIISHRLPETGPYLFAMHLLCLYGILKLSTYRLVFYDDRLVKKLWAKRQTVYYRDIDNLIIDSAVVDAYQIAKLSLRGKQRRFEKYRILDIRIAAKEQKIHFRTKWFDTFQQANQALSLLLEHVDNSVVKKGEYSPNTLLNEVVFVAKWILVFFLLTLIGNWLLSFLSVYTS